VVIDFHVHVFPDELAKRAIPKLACSAGISAFLDGTQKQLESSMAWAKIDKAVLQPVATRPQQASGINRWLAEIRSSSIDAFAAIHPGSETWQQDLDEIVALGFRGVKLHPDYQEFFVDDQKIFPFYKRIFQNDLYILFHAGVDVGLPPPVHCTPQRLRKVVDEFGGERIIAAHLGGWSMWEKVEEYLLGQSLFLDTSMSLAYLGKERARKLILSHGPQRVLFATDSPWSPQLSSLEQVRGLELEENDLAAILGGNAKQILEG
jgi:predicted TIM-barrel fold metal-dependent hydrolase